MIVTISVVILVSAEFASPTAIGIVQSRIAAARRRLCIWLESNLHKPDAIQNSRLSEQYSRLNLTKISASAPIFVEAVSLQDRRPSGVDVGHQLMAVPISLIGMVSPGEPEIGTRELVRR